MMKNLLIIGGGGYVGTVIIKELLNFNFKINNIDPFIYNHFNSINSIKTKDNFVQHNIDMRNIDKNFLKNIEFDYVLILGGLVGDPITKKYPELSEEINHHGIINVLTELKDFEIKKLIFISTCSNYGILKDDEIADEETILKPLSLYAKQKVKVEEYLINMSQNQIIDYEIVILRFATAFGLSDRMRFDLTINQFTRELFNNSILRIYDENTWRPYCHVSDFADIVRILLDQKIIKNKLEIFNAGSDNNNYRKIDIYNNIKKYIKNSKVEFQKNGNDFRNYKVSFSKLNESIKKEYKTIDHGIREIINQLKIDEDFRLNENYGNYEIET